MSDMTVHTSAREAAPDGAFNLRAALARIDDDEELFHTLVELFVEQGPKDLADACAALAAQDAAGVARAAHRLKGAVLQFCAPGVLEAARELEELGKAGDLTAATAAYARLEQAFRRLLEALRDSCKTESAS